MHKILFSSLILLCLLVPALLFAKVTALEMIIQKDLLFETGEYAGQHGLLVTIKDISITAQNSKTVYAYARVIRDEAPPFCEKQLAIKINTENMKIDIIRFQFPYSEIREIYGSGKQSFYVQFFFYALINSQPQWLDNFILNKQVQLELNTIETANPFEVYRQKNSEFIDKKAHHEPIYTQVQQLSRQLGLDFYVSAYPLSSSAAQDYTVVVPPAAPTIEDEKNLKNSLCILIPFLQSLPQDFIKTTKLKGIAFTKKITFSGYRVGGGVDIFRSTLLLDITSWQNFPDSVFLHIFCHEYFHYIEKIFYMHIDVAHWTSLNPPGFSYKPGGAMDYVINPEVNALGEHPQKGFTTLYAASDHYQDKAELFSYLMVPELYRAATGWLAGDSYLKAKFVYMQSILKKIHPALNETYFTGK